MMKKTNHRDTGLTQSAPGHAVWSSVLLCGALVASLFFNGSKFEYLSLSQIFLWSALLVSIWISCQRGVIIPKTSLALSVALFWFWLLLSSQFLPDTPAPITIDFWWLGTLPMVFWLYTLQSNANKVWAYVSLFVLLLGVLLSMIGIYHFFMSGKYPHAPFLYKNLLAALLNIIILMGAANYIIRSNIEDRHVSAFQGFILASLFVLVYTVVLINSRGVLLSLAAAMALLLLVSYPLTVRKKSMMVIVAVIMGAALSGMLSSKFYSPGGGVDVMGRIASLQQPYNAGKSRFIIWEASCNMLKQSPWLGTGLGTYALRYPPYRFPEDDSSGAYAHNDYLQLWIEGGLPALLFLVFMMVSSLFAFIRSMRGKDPPAGAKQNDPHLARDALRKSGENRDGKRRLQHKTQPPLPAGPMDGAKEIALRKVEIAGLFSCLLATALHSFFDFNFYVVPTMILLGLVLGRFHHLTTGQDPHGGKIKIDLHQYLRPYAFRLMVVVAAALPLLYLIGVGVAMYQYNRGVHWVSRGENSEALKSFSMAGFFWRSSDASYYGQAVVKKMDLQHIPKGNVAGREKEFKRAEALLTEAEKRNPWRPEIFHTRGLLYLENSDLAGINGTEKAAANFEKALKLNPLFYHARVAYASLLGKAGREMEAYKILKEGIHYYYTLNADILPYFHMSAKVFERMSDYKQREGLLEKIRMIENNQA